MAIVHPALAKFAAAVNEAYEKVCSDPEHNEYFDLFEETDLRLYTYDGVLTAKFWEEGIEFYPEVDKP